MNKASKQNWINQQKVRGWYIYLKPHDSPQKNRKETEVKKKDAPVHHACAQIYI